MNGIPCPYNVWGHQDHRPSYGSFYGASDRVIQQHLREEHPWSPFINHAEPCGALLGVALVGGGITLAAGLGAAAAFLWARRARS